MAPLHRDSSQPVGTRGSSDAIQQTASPAMRRLLRMLADAARHDAPVLLVGESGTGKTTLARVLHEMSARAARPFVTVDCRAGTGDLAAHAAAGRTGTLLIDEVGELSPAAQATALRLLEGAPPPPALPEVRVIACTRHDLEAQMAAGRFRRDLFYRLSVVELRIPPLRQRAEDVLPIARAFLTTHAEARYPPPELSADLERALIAYSWPGNVTELLSVLERATILARGSSLPVDVLPERMRARSSEPGS
jgi:DNA-binding NtrC family response regulator